MTIVPSETADSTSVTISPTTSGSGRNERSALLGYFRNAFLTTLNVLLFALTFGMFVWLEGRMSWGSFRNWSRRYRYKPPKIARPKTEQEIVDLVKNSSSLRVFGGGHSFNSAVVTDNTLVSLDRYSGVVSIDLDNKRLIVRGGTRLRDITKTLLKEGMALKALPSHDSQSIGGMLSTDVHGTGKDWAFVSDAVVGLKVIDGRGHVIKCNPTEELFKAAIGGAGAVGIIAEVELQAVGRFNVEQKVTTMTLNQVQSKFEQLLKENDHLSLYLFPFSKKVQVNTWNATERRKSVFGRPLDMLYCVMDTLASAWITNLVAYTRLLPVFSRVAYSIRFGSRFVMESSTAFKRKLIDKHQELEFAISFDDTWQISRSFMQLYEKMYKKESLPYMLIELRFTPAGHDCTLIGPGRERRSAWVNLIIADSAGFGKYYEAVAKVIREIDARPHIGKFFEDFDKTDMQRAHLSSFDRFLRMLDKHDPAGKFANGFTRRVFR